jgi:HK97 gp10 family phage protein
VIQFDISDLVAAAQGMVDQVTSQLDEPALRAIGFAGAAVFRDEAKRNALSHVKTGVLYNDIIVKRLEEESNSGLRQVYLVTVRKGRYGGDDAFYWRFVEYGHKFVPRRTSGKGWTAHRAAAALEYGTSTVPAYPFMRPAFDSKKSASIDAMTAKLRAMLERNATR